MDLDSFNLADQKGPRAGVCPCPGFSADSSVLERPTCGDWCLPCLYLLKAQKRDKNKKRKVEQEEK
jgi:hypothetical protein